MSIRSASELGAALRTTLQDHLADTIGLLGWDPAVLKPVREWQQLPTIDALASATFPAIAIQNGGAVSAPTYSRSKGGYESAWRISVGIYDRGRDHDETQALVQDWCAAIRLAVRAHRSLGGVATDAVWRGDRYDLMPNRNQARTFGAGAVAFDVSAFVIDSLGALPAVTSTPTTLSVQ